MTAPTKERRGQLRLILEEGRWEGPIETYEHGDDWDAGDLLAILDALDAAEAALEDKQEDDFAKAIALRVTVRGACRRRMQLGGADAQALEHALTQVERERDDLKAKLVAAEERIWGNNRARGKTSGTSPAEGETNGTGREAPGEAGLRGVREANGREDVGRTGHANLPSADAEHRGSVGGGGDGNQEGGRETLLKASETQQAAETSSDASVFDPVGTRVMSGSEPSAPSGAPADGTPRGSWVECKDCNASGVVKVWCSTCEGRGGVTPAQADTDDRAEKAGYLRGLREAVALCEEQGPYPDVVAVSLWIQKLIAKAEHKGRNGSD